MLQNMKIRSRLLISYAIVILLLLISGIVSIVMLDQVGDSLASFYNEQFQTVNNAWSARRTVFSARSSVLQALVEEGTDETRTAIESAKTDFQSIKDTISEVEKTFQGDMSLLSEVESLLSQAEPYLDEIGDLAIAARNDEAYEILMNDYKPLMDSIRANLTTVGEEADANAYSKVESAETLKQTADLIIFAIIVISIAASILLALVMAESIRKPVMEMKRVSAEVAEGRLDTEITYKSKDELGETADSMREMTTRVRTILTDVEELLSAMGNGNFDIRSKVADAYVGQFARLLEAIRMLNTSLSDTLSQIDVSADQVNSGGEQVSSSAQALAQGATEQASSVEELAATINEISHQVEKTADHAKTAKEENLQSHAQIQTCSSHMNDLMGAMGAIDSKSKEISKVIKTIEDIAFQTNILALNAAVEAARAGTAGKGFAVVADEVRNLATKSQEASKSTAALIDETVKAVDEGTRLSSETDQALREVVESAQKVLDAVTLISEATEEQSRAVTQVTQGIDQISSVVQTNSATAEESAAASEELSGQANLLKELVGRFTLRKDAIGRASAAPAPARASSGYSGHTGYAGSDKY